MPKKVDHHDRRTRIADALMRVAAHRGLEAVSLRHVATEAGVSAGMVQHYFRTKDEMMAFALAVVREHFQARATAAVARLDGSPPIRTLLRTTFAGLLPLDDAGRADARVALAFLAYSAVRPTTGAGLREDSAVMLTYLAGQIRTAQSAGQARADIDPDRTAVGLLALMEGLGIYLLGGHYDADTALAAIDAYLGLIFDGAAGPAGMGERRHTGTNRNVLPPG